MAKPTPKPPIETPVVLMRKIGPERFDVVEGVVVGDFRQTKILESNVSLVVGRGTARRALDIQHRKNAATLGLSVDV